MNIKIAVILSLAVSLSGCVSYATDMTHPRYVKTDVFYVTTEANVPKTDLRFARVQQLTPAHTQTASSKRVVMLPGLGLSSTLYLSTPDQRQGWASIFAQAGHTVLVMDPINTGPSGIHSNEPVVLTQWNSAQIWPRWGLGEAKDIPYPKSQFPHDAVEQFYASFATRVMHNAFAQEAKPESTVGRGHKSRGRHTTAANSDDLNALVNLLKQHSPNVLLVHSMSGNLGFAIAQRYPELLEALVVIEPVGCPTRSIDLQSINIPVLAIYGDYIESRNQTRRKIACQKTINHLNEQGVKATMLDLPLLGIQGNSHVLMVDKNHLDIAQMIMSWLAQ